LAFTGLIASIPQPDYLATFTKYLKKTQLIVWSVEKFTIPLTRILLCIQQGWLKRQIASHTLGKYVFLAFNHG